jgi:hypothetical protein
VLILEFTYVVSWVSVQAPTDARRSASRATEATVLERPEVQPVLDDAEEHGNSSMLIIANSTATTPLLGRGVRASAATSGVSLSSSAHSNTLE